MSYIPPFPRGTPRGTELERAVSHVQTGADGGSDDPRRALLALRPRLLVRGRAACRAAIAEHVPLEAQWRATALLHGFAFGAGTAYTILALMES
jgi:hypothetical protein